MTVLVVWKISIPFVTYEPVPENDSEIFLNGSQQNRIFIIGSNRFATEQKPFNASQWLIPVFYLRTAYYFLSQWKIQFNIIRRFDVSFVKSGDMEFY